MKTRRVSHLIATVVVAVSMASLTSAAVASDIEISLEVKSAKQRVSANRTEEAPSPQKAAARPVFTGKAGEDLVVSWKVTNVGKQDTFKDVLIHCVVVAEKEPGQATVPDLKDAVQESALTMDFAPGGSATGEFSLSIDQPGAYLVRVETLNMRDAHGHEHYAALDLVRK
ncbi:MAG: hypothetical protein WD875_19235 [Pirellulales bacterium]